MRWLRGRALRGPASTWSWFKISQVGHSNVLYKSHKISCYESSMRLLRAGVKATVNSLQGGRVAPFVVEPCKESQNIATDEM